MLLRNESRQVFFKTLTNLCDRLNDITYYVLGRSLHDPGSLSRFCLIAVLLHLIEAMKYLVLLFGQNIAITDLNYP